MDEARRNQLDVLEDIDRNGEQALANDALTLTAEQATAAALGTPADTAAADDTGSASLISLTKRLLSKLPTLGAKNGAGSVSVVSATDDPVSVNLGAKADAAATLTVVDDPVAIADAGLTSLVPSGKVWKLDNSLGTGTARIAFDGQTNNTLTNTVSAYIRGSAGYIGYNSGSTAQKTAFVASASYVRRTHTASPDAATRTSQILANPGDVVYFILPQMEDGNVATDPIVTQGSVTSAGSPFTIVAQADFPNLDGQSIYLCSVAAGTSSNDRLVLDRTNGNTSRGLMITGAVSQPSNGSGSKTGARVLRIASRNRNSEQRNAFDNTLVATTSIIPATGLDTMNVGVNQVRSGSFLNGYVQQLLVYGDVDDTKLAAA